MTRIISKTLVASLLAVCATSASASFQVNVGYADTLRPSPYVPSPWAGSTGVIFAGGTSDGYYDAGAIEIINTGSTAITFNDLTVGGFGSGASFNLWGSWAGQSIAAGQSMIFTQTASYNFDTSDYDGGNYTAIPNVLFTIDGVNYSYNDTAQILNTEGSDWLAQQNQNESHQWREIGTYGGQAAIVPEPEQWAMLLLGLSLLSHSMRRKSA